MHCQSLAGWNILQSWCKLPCNFLGDMVITAGSKRSPNVLQWRTMKLLVEQKINRRIKIENCQMQWGWISLLKNFEQKTTNELTKNTVRKYEMLHALQDLPVEKLWVKDTHFIAKKTYRVTCIWTECEEFKQRRPDIFKIMSNAEWRKMCFVRNLQHTQTQLFAKCKNNTKRVRRTSNN